MKFHDNRRAPSELPATSPAAKLTAEDVKYSIERQINDSEPAEARCTTARASGRRSTRLERSTDPTRCASPRRSPIAPFLHYLADRNAHIVAEGDWSTRTTSMNTDKAMIGTGPFQLEDFTGVEFVKVRRNPTWFAKDDNPHGIGMDRPFLDGYDSLWTPQSDSTQEAALRSKQVDSTGFEDDANGGQRRRRREQG